MARYLSHAALIVGSALACVSDAAGNSWQTISGKYFAVSYQSQTVPLPLNRIHSWQTTIKTVDDGRPVEGAVVKIYGGMPAHRHGLPTQPRTTEVGNGRYLIRGLKFSMMGDWEVWLDVTYGSLSEKLVFKLSL